MSKQFVILDDSGDPGLVKSSTSHFIVAAVLIVSSENYDKLVAAINGFRAALGWNELDEIKFNKTRKIVIKRLLKLIQQFEFKTYAMVVDKAKITKEPQLASGETLYNQVIKELLLKINLSDPIIFIDGVTDKIHIQKTRTYLRQALRQSGIEKSKIRFVDSRKDVLIQLADVVAGVIARSYNKRNNDDEFIRLLKPKIESIYEIIP